MNLPIGINLIELSLKYIIAKYRLTDDYANSMISYDKRTNIKKDYKSPSTRTWLRLERLSTRDDVKKQKLQKMPGFRISWYYTGPQVEPEAYLNTRGGQGSGNMESSCDETKIFVRNRYITCFETMFLSSDTFFKSVKKIYVSCFLAFHKMKSIIY